MPAWLKNLTANSWLMIFICFVALEGMSFLVFPYPWASRIAFIAALIIAAILTIYKTEFGAYLLMAELAVGGMGYLLFFPIDGGRLSLRLAIFIVIGLISLVKIIKKSNLKRLFDWRLLPLAIFFILFAISAVDGLLNHHSVSAVFSDANAYLYFALVGLFICVKLKPIKLIQIILIGSFVLGIKTVIVLFLFSHGLAQVGPSLLYHWIRDTGTGEIALIASPLYRVFFQSHFYNLIALIVSAFILLIRPSEAGQEVPAIDSLGQSRSAKGWLWFLAWFNLFVLVISQSRSFWLAGSLILVFVLPVMAIYYHIVWRRVAVYLLLIPAFIGLSNFAGQITIGNFQTDFFSGRVSGESGSAGVSSRMAELAPAWALIRQAPLIGNGFGATVHFRSDDPRIKNSSNPEGWTDAPAIEWGFLDLAVKMGFLGLTAYLIFLGGLIWPLLKSIKKQSLLSAGLLAGLMALLIAHIFTPYLNHPLGIGYVLALLALSKKSEIIMK